MFMKITVIAPMESIVQTAREVLRKQDFGRPVEIEVVQGVLEAGLEEAFSAIERGTDAIVSRGGTASLIARNVEIPVAEIQVTAFDILRALKEMGVVNGPVGVVFGRRLLFECEKLGELIGVPIREIHIGNDVFEERIAAALRDGISTFLGDAFSVRLLKERGQKVFPIQSSEDAVSRAIADAINLATVRRREQEKAELFRTIVNASDEGIIAIDRSGTINVFNPAAEQMMQIRSTNAIGRPVGDIIPDDKLRDCLSGDKYEGEDVKSINDRVFAIKRIPIRLNREVVGAISNMQDVTKLQYFEQVVRRKLNAKGLVAKFHLEQLIGASPVMKAVKERLRQYAGTDTTVLIIGESGTGKERAAQSIHNLSPCKNGPFVAVNCAALPEHLLESELFGYEEGAFTGAKKGGKAGLFELAHGGTIFLDEISEMPLPLQARLLRVLQEKEVMKLGADRLIPVNVRVLASTNQDLMSLVEAKKFRADLYYRLDVFRLHIPPLRERMEDIPELVRSFLERPASFTSRVSGITPEAVAFLQEQSWRGNVRELKNVIDRLRLLSAGPMIGDEDVRQELAGQGHLEESGPSGGSPEDVEKEKISRVLEEEKYNHTRAARRLGISRSTLWRKLKEKDKSI
jgi:PAS domain S-box-containing protein